MELRTSLNYTLKSKLVAPLLYFSHGHNLKSMFEWNLAYSTQKSRLMYCKNLKAEVF